jgi:hypothetical protein
MAIKIKNSSGVEEIITLYATTAEMNGTGISTSHWLPVSKSSVTYYAGLIPESLSTPPEVVAMKSSLKVSIGGVTYAVAFASKQATTSTNGAVIPATADNRGFLLQYSITGARGAGAAGAQGGGGTVAASNPVSVPNLWYGVAIAGGSGSAGANSAVPTTSSRALTALTTSEANQWIGSTVTLSSGAATAATSGAANYSTQGLLFTYKLASAPGNTRYSVGPGAAAKDSAPGAGGSSSSLTTSGGYTATGSGTSGGSGTSNQSGTQVGLEDRWVLYVTGSRGGAGGGPVGGDGQFAQFTVNPGVNFPYTQKNAGSQGVSTGNGGTGGAGGNVTYYSISNALTLSGTGGSSGSNGAAGDAGSASYTATYWIKGAY